MTAFTQRKRLLLVLLSGILLLSACSTTPKTTPTTEPPMRTYEELVDQSKTYPIQVYDPLEGFNRGMYRFNYYFDKFIFLPIVRTYEFITPDFMEQGVSNFVDNVYEFNNFVNNLLQLKFKATGITLARFAVNTTFGVAGLFDPASTMELKRQKEDFGQTLGHYGVGNGPYLVLPIFGPSNLRDTTGLVADSLAFSNFGPPAWVDDETATLVFTGVAAVDKRHRIPFRYYKTGSPFEYDMVRLLYTSQREIVIEK
jgi:phospholipid-binding lipoprotein MlaA